MVGHWNRDRNRIAYKMARYPRYNPGYLFVTDHCYSNFFPATFSFSKNIKKKKKKKKEENFSSLLNIFAAFPSFRNERITGWIFVGWTRPIRGDRNEDGRESIFVADFRHVRRQIFGSPRPSPLQVYLQVQRLPGLRRETMIRGEPENVKFRNKRDRKSCTTWSYAGRRSEKLAELLLNINKIIRIIKEA